MAGLTSQIRTYSTVGANYGVPTMADKMGLRVMAGAWIDVDPKKNRQEIDNLVALATNNGSVSRVTVGNEAIYKNLVKVPQLIQYIREVKRRLPASRSAPRSRMACGSIPSCWTKSTMSPSTSCRSGTASRSRTPSPGRSATTRP
jgi:hypothetical protein